MAGNGGRGRWTAGQGAEPDHRRPPVWSPAEPLPEDREPTSPWGVSWTDRDGEPSVEPGSSLRRPLGRSEVFSETADTRFDRRHASDHA